VLVVETTTGTVGGGAMDVVDVVELVVVVGKATPLTKASRAPQMFALGVGSPMLDLR
jgi:hypothetical protein